MADKSCVTLSFPAVSFLANIFGVDGQPEAENELLEVAVQTFQSTRINRSPLSGFSYANDTQHAWQCISFNLRAFIPDTDGSRAARLRRNMSEPTNEGFPLRRETAKMPGLAKNELFFGVEWLISVSLVIRSRTTNPYGMAGQSQSRRTETYSLIGWMDYEPEYFEHIEDSYLIPMEWSSNKIRPCSRHHVKFTQLLCMMANAISAWYRSWNKTLDRIDESVGFKVRLFHKLQLPIARNLHFELAQLDDTHDEERWEILMFDEQFQLSKKYTTFIQLIRIFRTWLRETKEDFEAFMKRLAKEECPSEECSSGDTDCPLAQSWQHNCKQIDDLFNSRHKSLDDRFERKANELEALRDGVRS